MINELRDSYRASVRKICALFGMPTSVYYYKPSRRDANVLASRIKEIANARVQFGELLLSLPRGAIADE